MYLLYLSIEILSYEAPRHLSATGVFFLCIDVERKLIASPERANGS